MPLSINPFNMEKDNKKKCLIYGVIPARSGSKGIRDKNIKKILGKELMGYSIEFAKTLSLDRIICSTDSEKYAKIARKYGAEVPFLRAGYASVDSAMEEHILHDLYDKFDEHSIEYPDLFVWLRPTFIFRDMNAVKECIRRLKEGGGLTACRVVTEAESRLYLGQNGILKPAFDDNGRSMVRRQEVGTRFRVFNTDVFRGKPKNCGPTFLGNNIGYVVADKLCGVDIDDETDLLLASHLLASLKK